ncbi:MAG: hypothetical protein WC926_01855 [Candidatus Paceibacterota bacterium]|jgi:hypothetical protein
MNEINNDNGKRFFRSDQDWWNNACLNFRNDHLNGCAEGYKEAADVLVHQVIEQKLTIDKLIYPIVFLYRHYLEIRFKEIIKNGNSYLDNPVDNWGHGLTDLWNKVRHIVRIRWPETTDEDLQAICDCVNEFKEIDPKSTSFRYAKFSTIEGESLSYINIRNLHDQMEKVEEILEGISMGIKYS